MSWVTEATVMLYTPSFSTTNYDAALIAWALQSIQTGTNFGVHPELCYSAGAAATAHATIEATWGTITDAGECP